jgi:hypothetical protein
LHPPQNAANATFNEFSTFEIFLELCHRGWSYEQRKSSRKNDPIYTPGGQKLWLYNRSISRHYLQVLLQSNLLFAAGLEAIYHHQPSSYYKALLNVKRDKRSLTSVKPRQPLSFYKLLQQKEKHGKNNRKGQADQPARMDLDTDEVEIQPSTPGRASRPWGPIESWQFACNVVATVCSLLVAGHGNGRGHGPSLAKLPQPKSRRGRGCGRGRAAPRLEPGSGDKKGKEDDGDSDSEHDDGVAISSSDEESGHNSGSSISEESEFNAESASEAEESGGIAEEQAQPQQGVTNPDGERSNRAKPVHRLPDPARGAPSSRWNLSTVWVGNISIVRRDDQRV